jgi:hypothetical protein
MLLTALCANFREHRTRLVLDHIATAATHFRGAQ